MLKVSHDSLYPYHIFEFGNISLIYIRIYYYYVIILYISLYILVYGTFLVDYNLLGILNSVCALYKPLHLRQVESI
jgi:hypothetical protein